MAKNESLAVLHATLDFRRIIDVPGYDRIPLHSASRFIATMNYGYAGTRELNEALASRFLVIRMPVISPENLEKLLVSQFPTLKKEYVSQFAALFDDIRRKCDGGEISSKALDLRGLLSALRLVYCGLDAGQELQAVADAVGQGAVVVVVGQKGNQAGRENDAAGADLNGGACPALGIV